MYIRVFKFNFFLRYLWLIGVALPLIVYMAGILSTDEDVVAVIFILLFGLLCLISYYYFTQKIVIHNNKLESTRGFKSKVIFFENIESINYIGEAIQIISPNEKIHISSLIGNFDKLFDEIINTHYGEIDKVKLPLSYHFGKHIFIIALLYGHGPLVVITLSLFLKNYKGNEYFSTIVFMITLIITAFGFIVLFFFKIRKVEFLDDSIVLYKYISHKIIIKKDDIVKIYVGHANYNAKVIVIELSKPYFLKKKYSISTGYTNFPMGIFFDHLNDHYQSK